jgi:hypothetical protein
MSRIRLNNLNAVHELSRQEMKQTSGGMAPRLNCHFVVRLVRVRTPFGFKIVRQVVRVCTPGRPGPLTF